MPSLKTWGLPCSFVSLPFPCCLCLRERGTLFFEQMKSTWVRIFGITGPSFWHLAAHWRLIASGSAIDCTSTVCDEVRRRHVSIVRLAPRRASLSPSLDKLIPLRRLTPKISHLIPEQLGPIRPLEEREVDTLTPQDTRMGSQIPGMQCLHVQDSILNENSRLDIARNSNQP